MLPYTSHYTACWGFANFLKENGIHPLFLGQAANRALVEEQNFDFRELYYSVPLTIWNWKSFIGISIKSRLDKNDLRFRYKDWMASVLHIIAIVDEFMPDYIFIDEHLSYYHFYLFHNKTIKLTLNTKLSTRKRKNVPPLNEFFIPSDSFISSMFCELLWAKQIFIKWIRRKIAYSAFNFRDETYFITRLIRNLGLNPIKEIDGKNPFYKVAKNYLTITLAPKKIEFQPETISRSEIYFDFEIKRNETTLLSQEYLNIKTSVQKRKLENSETKIIYLSMGSIPGGDYKKLNDFVAKFYKKISKKENWILLASGVPNNDHQINVIQCTFYSLPFLPQLDVLSYCDVFVTHGGLGSIKEALQFKTPMLVHPKFNDGFGNCARLVSKGLAKRLNWALLAKQIEELLKRP